MRIAITGSNGLVGRNLTQYFFSKNWEVREFKRNPDKTKKNEFYYDLNEKLNDQDFNGVDVIIHAAYQAYSKKNPHADESNLNGTQNLLKLARRINAKFIYLSTFSAHESAESHYGKSKFEIEKIFNNKTDLILRLGLVMARGGLASSMAEIIQKAPVIPLIGGGKQPLQFIDIHDLCLVIERAIQKNITGIYNIGSPDVISMRDFNEAIARRIGKSPKFLSVPLPFVYGVLKLIETFGIELSITTEGALGLKHMIKFDTHASLKEFDINPKGLDESLNCIL